MVIVIGIIKTLVAWVILMIIGTNLLGYVVRGLLWSPTCMEEKLAKIAYPELKRMTPTKNFVITLVAVNNVSINHGE